GVVPLRRGRSKVLAGLAAAAAAAAVALGAVAVDARRDLGEAGARNQEMIAVLAAPDAQTVRQPVTPGGTGTVVISRSAGRMVFTSSGLPEPPRARGYALWLMGPDGPRPAGMLERGEDGITTPVVLTPSPDDAHIAITVEPATGSRKPTTQPILLAELPTA
ncbi:anti-sigma factor, partial [Nonomuraea sp. K274]